MSDIKVVAVGKDGGPVRVGNDFHVLEDHTKETFNTCIVSDFLRYVKLSETMLCLYYDEKYIKAIPGILDHQTVLAAVCALENSPFLNILLGVNGKPLGIKAFEALLFDLRSFWGDAKCKTLHEKSKKFVLQKVTSVERTEDNQGNFSFIMTRKGAKENEAFPPEISFKVPVFSFLPDLIEIKFGVRMDYSEREDCVDISFTLRNPAIEVELRERQKEIIEEALSEYTGNKYWGSLDLHKQDNSWKYQSNGLR
ncbi:MAG: hypothetical protein PHE17_18030 [Thiothrix sp.]|uniref:hypothetical protein n=1 Tax=Thiothrix sp. TaxID=1032 RepID=UPI00260E39C1|nr:hypothetical protein [Thiothrix sp.]MDD5394920.1 hypothetical protein [Thiothrix sp.]